MQNASLAARRLCGHITAARDLANQRLLLEAAPLGWVGFVTLLIDKCHLPLELPHYVELQDHGQPWKLSKVCMTVHPVVFAPEGTAPLIHYSAC
jgi:hypothetical protein